MSEYRKTEGARAFNRGVERDRCPHAPGTDAFRDWMAGWARQKAEFQTRLHQERLSVTYAKASRTVRPLRLVRDPVMPLAKGRGRLRPRDRAACA